MNYILLALLRDYKRYWGKASLTLIAFILSLCLFLNIELFIAILSNAQNNLDKQNISHRIIHQEGPISIALSQRILNESLITSWIPQDKIQDIWIINKEKVNIEVCAYNSDQGIDIWKTIDPTKEIKNKKEILEKLNKNGSRRNIFVLKAKVETNLSRLEIKEKQAYSMLIQDHIDIVEIPIEHKGKSLAFIDIAQFQGLYNKGNYIQSLGIKINKKKINKLKEQLKKININLRLQSIEEIEKKQNKWLSSLNHNLKFLGLIALLVSISLCAQCFNFIHHKRKNLYQSLILIGAQPKDIKKAKLFECSSIAIITTILALALASIITTLSLDLFNYFIQTFYFYMDAKYIIISKTLIIKAFLVSFSALGLSYISYGNRLKKRDSFILLSMASTILAILLLWLSQTHHKTLGLIITLMVVFCILLISIGLTSLIGRMLRKIKNDKFWQLKLAAEHYKKNCLDLAIISFVIALALGLILTMFIYVNSFKSTVITWLNTSLTKDIYIQHQLTTIRQSYPINKSILEKIQKQCKKENIQSIQKYNLEWRNLPLIVNAISDLYQAKNMNYMFKEKIQSNTKLSNESIIISEALALKHQIKINEDIMLPSLSKEPLHVVGIMYDYVSEYPTIYMPQKAINQNKEKAIHGIAITFSQTTNESNKIKHMAFVNKLAKENNLNIQNEKTLKKQSLDIFDETFLFTWFIVGITALLSLFSLLNLISLICAQRQAELQQLWLIGANKKQLSSIILAQCRSLIFLAIIIAIISGLSLYVCLVYGIQKPTFSWTIFLDIPYKDICSIIAMFIIMTELIARLCVYTLPEHFLKGDQRNDD
eukprot:COSAG01_NODE_52_length_31456_cov_125.226648_24_plen_825_part_00